MSSIPFRRTTPECGSFILRPWRVCERGRQRRNLGAMRWLVGSLPIVRVMIADDVMPRAF